MADASPALALDPGTPGQVPPPVGGPLTSPRHLDAPPVMIVDDDPVARELAARMLAKLQLANPVVFASHAEQALSLLGGGTRPALILLDLAMPGQSGLDVLGWLRAQAPLRDVPVIMLTASAELDEVERAYELGIRSYLVKPVGFAALRDVVRDLGLPWVLLAPG